MIYVRWKAGESRRGRVFNPVVAGDPLAAMPCPAPGCGLPLRMPWPVAVVLVAVGPVDDGDDRVSHDEGRWHNAGAAVLHQPCADQLTDSELDVLAEQLIVADGAMDETAAAASAP
jgi:hypothetical protein